MGTKICPTCGRKMKQQFIDLKHCKCGTSWKKDIGYFERTDDMIFALERKNIGKKVKQVAVIRYKKNEQNSVSDSNINHKNSDIEKIKTQNMAPITIKKFAELTVKNNPKDYKLNELIETLTTTLTDKNNGAKCMICGQPIWAAGSAITGTYMCFSCTTGEADSSEDYEIY